MKQSTKGKLTVSRMLAKKCKSWRKYETHPVEFIEEMEQWAEQLRVEAEQESK